jgi:hypothetical protein
MTMARMSQGRRHLGRAEVFDVGIEFQGVGGSHLRFSLLSDGSNTQTGLEAVSVIGPEAISSRWPPDRLGPHKEAPSAGHPS